MRSKPSPKRVPGDLVRKADKVSVVSCRKLKTAIAREIRAAVKDRTMASRLVNSLGTEVAYGSGGGGGGVGVA